MRHERSDLALWGYSLFLTIAFSAFVPVSLTTVLDTKRLPFKQIEKCWGVFYAVSSIPGRNFRELVSSQGVFLVLFY